MSSNLNSVIRWKHQDQGNRNFYHSTPLNVFLKLAEDHPTWRKRVIIHPEDQSLSEKSLVEDPPEVKKTKKGQ